MEELFNKENVLVCQPIQAFIQTQLSDGFMTNQDRAVTKTDRVNILSVQVDIEQSEMRETIVITRVDARAKVWIKMNEDATTNRELTLRISSRINLIFNPEQGEYQIHNDDLALTDLTF